MSKRVIVGMSGGVDSSVAAYLLKKQGFEVVGLFMKNWNEEDCTAKEDFKDVSAVCDQLDIPYYTVNFVKEYWDEVFQTCLEEFKKGFTPNPDILCNQKIKFRHFYERALEIGADYVATGHYCRTIDGKLLTGKDSSKDQSYFLHAVKGEVLEKVLFPIGELEKKEVREIAANLGLKTAKKKDSTGLCFIGERKFAPFLSSFLSPQKGEIRTLDGKKVGEHNGVQFFTRGQRKGLGLGGPGEPWFVVKKDQKNNYVYVVRGKNHSALFNKVLFADSATWVNKAITPGKYDVKIRYRQKSVP